MRASVLALVLSVASSTAMGQRGARPVERDSAPPAPASSRAPGAAASGAATATQVRITAEVADSLRRLIDRFRQDPEGSRAPARSSFTLGGVTVAAGATMQGPVAVAGGPLNVYGTINGDAIAVSGDVIVHAGGRVSGDAVAAFGEVVLSGGRVDGELRELRGAVGTIPRGRAAEEQPAGRTRHAIGLAGSSLVIMVLIGIGVLVFAGGYLDGVVEALEGRFARSFWAGIAAQLALAPALLLIIVALALTIIGILAIPLAIVLFLLAVAGLATLGFLAVARVTGESISPGVSTRLHPRGAALRAIVVGVSIYMGIWVLAAVFAWAPIVETVLRGIAVAVTWVAATAGMGAAVISRGGTRRAGTPAAVAAVNDPVWQTPTPVAGVVAARRPTPASSTRSR